MLLKQETNKQTKYLLKCFFVMFENSARKYVCVCVNINVGIPSAEIIQMINFLFQIQFLLL